MRKLSKVMLVLALVITVLFISYLTSRTCIEHELSDPTKCVTFQTGFERAQIFTMQLMESWFIWIIIAIPIILFAVYALMEWVNVFGKFKFASKFDPKKRIPQPKRREILKEYIDNEFLLSVEGKPLTFVNNYISPERDDAQPGELMLFTTSQAYADRRIKEEEIDPKDAFYGHIHCINGECMTMDFLSHITFQGAVKFYDRYWFMSIKQRVETPIEMWMKKSMAEAVGQEFVRGGMPEKKEEAIENEQK